MEKTTKTKTFKYHLFGISRLLKVVFASILLDYIILPVGEFFKALKEIFFPKLSFPKLNIKCSLGFKKCRTRMEESCKSFIKRIKQ